MKGSLIEQFAQLLLPPVAVARHLVRWMERWSSNVWHFKWPTRRKEAHDICQIIGSEMETEKRIREDEEEEEESEFDRQATRI